MFELSIEDFTRFVVRKIETISNVVLNNPDNEEQFPLTVVNSPMESIRTVEENIPIYKRFSINVEHWTNSKYESMTRYQEVNELLRKCNFTPVGTPTDLYDVATQKYRYGIRYEVNYNGLTNSFERIK